MVTSVSSLLKTVRSVEDEASRGVRAIESTVDAVRQAVIVWLVFFLEYVVNNTHIHKLSLPFPNYATVFHSITTIIHYFV